MKIQAKQVKVGQTIKSGVVTITVEKIEYYTLKNGKTGRTFHGPALRTFGKGVSPDYYNSYEINVKDETFVSVANSISAKSTATKKQSSPKTTKKQSSPKANKLEKWLAEAKQDVANFNANPVWFDGTPKPAYILENLQKRVADLEAELAI